MKKYLLLLICFNAVNSLQAQSNSPATQVACGVSAQGTADNFIINYTNDEMELVKSRLSNGLKITQRVLLLVPFIADAQFECYWPIEIKVYPKPSSRVFILRWSLLKKVSVKTLLFEASGKLLQTNEFANNTFSTTQYNIQNLTNRMYYLQLYFNEAGSMLPKNVDTLFKI